MNLAVKMKKNWSFLILFTILNIPAFVFAQNVGQKAGDTIINYIDINGLKQGYWEKKYPNGKIKYQAHFKNDIPVGEFKRYYSNGQLFAHIIYDKEGNGTGDATYYWDDGKLLAKGKLVKVKLKQGLWKIYNTKGVLLRTINYDKGIKNGEQITYYHEGGIAEKANFKNGKKEGELIKYFPNGKKELLITYKNGVFDGPILSYYPNGQLKVKGFYKNDLKDGVWKFYDDNGHLIKTIEYENGHPVNETELDEELTKKIKELDKESSKYKEPDVDDFFNPRFSPQNNRRKQRRTDFEEY